MLLLSKLLGQKKDFQNFIYSSYQESISINQWNEHLKFPIYIILLSNSRYTATPSIAPSAFPNPPWWKSEKNSQKNPSITYSKAKCPIIRVGGIPAEYAAGDEGIEACRVTIEKLWASFRFTWRIDFPLSLSLPLPKKETPRWKTTLPVQGAASRP